jgi:hypothetical protein
LGRSAPLVGVRSGRQKIALRPVTASQQDRFTANPESAGGEDLGFLTRAGARQVLEPLRASDT